MVSRDKVIVKLKDSMNLNVYEAGVYLALLSSGMASAGELAEISKVPRSRCYDVLESLEKKGFVFMKIGKPIRYMAVKPDNVIDTLKRETDMESQSSLALCDEMEQVGVIDELNKLHKASSNHFNTEDVSTLIKGKQNINMFMKEMFSRASEKIDIHTNEEKRKLKILKKSRSKVPFKLNNDSRLKMVKVDDEMLLFTSPSDVKEEHESAVWIKGNFMNKTLDQFMK